MLEVLSSFMEISLKTLKSNSLDSSKLYVSMNRILGKKTTIDSENKSQIKLTIWSFAKKLF